MTHIVKSAQLSGELKKKGIDNSPGVHEGPRH